jgi:CAAX protease family protein
MASLPPSGSWPAPLPPLPPAGGAPNADPVTREPLPPWPAWMAPAALGVAFIVAIFGGIVVALVGRAFGASLDHAPPAVNLAATIVQDLAFVGTALAFARQRGPLSPAQLGLRRTPLRAALGMMAVTLIGFYVLSGLWAALLNLHERDQLPNDLGIHQSTAALVAACVLVTVIAPVAEELLFRGFFFTALRGWRGPWVAALVTGLVFGAIHVASAPVAFLAPLALLGFLLCLLRWKTGSLLPCMSVHALNNAIAFGVNEAHWTAGQTILLILGANGVILLGSVPFLRGGRWPDATRA